MSSMSNEAKFIWFLFLVQFPVIFPFTPWYTFVQLADKHYNLHLVEWRMLISLQKHSSKILSRFTENLTNFIHVKVHAGKIHLKYFWLIHTKSYLIPFNMEAVLLSVYLNKENTFGFILLCILPQMTLHNLKTCL